MSTRLRPDATYSFEHVYPGTYTVVFERPGTRVDPVERRGIVVRAGETTNVPPIDLSGGD